MSVVFNNFTSLDCFDQVKRVKPSEKTEIKFGDICCKHLSSFKEVLILLCKCVLKIKLKSIRQIKNISTILFLVFEHIWKTKIMCSADINKACNSSLIR